MDINGLKKTASAILAKYRQNLINNHPFIGTIAMNLDLVPIVAKMFGKKDSDEVRALSDRGIIPKDRYQYAVNIVKVLNPTMRQYILEIRRIDTKALNELGQSIGYGVMTGNIVMTRR